MKDENEGKGGSYIRDPETGERKLVERTDAPAPTPAEPETSQRGATRKPKE
jgi:hypothetical protein